MLTTKSTSSLQILFTHNLSMLDPWPSPSRDALDVFACLFAFVRQNAFENVKNNFVCAVPDAMNILWESRDQKAGGWS